MKHYLLTSNEDWADEHNVPALAVMNEVEFDKWSQTKLQIRAFLGNSGDYFMDMEQGKTGAELISLKKVQVTEVDENFVSTFKKAKLSMLSLSSIFDLDNYSN
jgi:hypothetical protein